MFYKPDDFICIMFGSRTWFDDVPIHAEVERLIQRYGARLLIRHGDEPNGADVRIYEACEALNVRHIEYCAFVPRHTPHHAFYSVWVSCWSTDGKAAGPIRNQAMSLDGAHGAVGFRMPGVSRGTDNMKRLAESAGIPVIMRQPLTPRGD